MIKLKIEQLLVNCGCSMMFRKNNFINYSSSLSLKIFR